MGSADCAAEPAAAVIPAAAIDPNTLLIFSVELDKITLTDGLGAYGDPADPLLPVGEFTRLLEYDVEVSPRERRIVGRLGEARTSLVVDLPTGTARVGGRTVQLAAQDVAVSDAEIFLRASALQKLLPLKLKIDSADLSMGITAEALLPVQSRLQRQARQRDSSSGAAAGQDPVLKVGGGYALANMPSVDVTLVTGASTNGGADGPQYPFRYDLRAAGDLLWGGYEAYLGSDEEGKPSTARFTMSRRSLDGRLLGPLKARQLGLGDVYTPSLAIGPRGMGGRGVMFSTVPLDQTNVFNRIDLRGELPLGYDVELYVNDVLQGGQNTPTKGRYEFLSVPLTRGINVIRIVSYGPHGERSENTRLVNVGGGQMERGDLTFEFGAVQQEQDLLRIPGVESEDFVSGSKGRLRVVGAVNYGLTSLITLTGGAALIPVPDADDRAIATLGARTSLFGFFTQFDAGYDSDGGLAAGVGLAGELGGVSTTFRYVGFSGGFVDENGPGADFTRPLRNRAELSLDGNLELRGAIIPVSFRTARVTYSDGAVDIAASLRGSSSIGPILYSGGLEFARNTSPTLTQDRLSGFFAFSTFRSFKWQIRGTFDYGILPDFEPRSIALTVDRDLSPTTSLRFGVGQSLTDLNAVNVTASALFRLKLADLALNAEYNNASRDVRLGAQLNFGLAYDPGVHSYGISRPGVGSGGSAAFHAFVDANGNGRFDKGEAGVPNLEVEAVGQVFTTDASGRTFVTGLGSSPTTRMSVNLDRLDNPSVKTPPLVVQVSPRPGEVTRIEYPVQPTGEVMVKVMLRRPDNSLVGLSSVQVRLVGPKGPVGDVKTEFDGSASFQELPGGTYQLELDPEQAKRLRMRLVAPVSVTVKTDGSFNRDARAEVAFEPRPAEEGARQTGE